METVMDYLFQDLESGEFFLVEETNLEECYRTLAWYGFDSEYIAYRDVMSVAEGEALGLDTF